MVAGTKSLTEGDQSMPPISFQRSADAIKLHQELLVTPVGTVVTYVKLGDVIGKPVSGSTGALRTARRAAQNEDRMVFSCIRMVGLKRLDDEGIVTYADEKNVRVRRGAWRVRRLIPLADLTKLRESSRQRAIAIASVLAVVTDLTRERSLLTVGQSTAGNLASTLPIKETLRALGF
jgi:hypothetical protein